MNEKQKNLITDYVIKLIDETIKPQEFEELNAVLSSDPQAAEHYNRMLMMISNFQECGKEIISDNKSANLVLKKEFWQAFAEDEKTAPVVQIPQKRQIEEPIQEIGRQNVQIKINRGSLITLVLSMAAVILFVLIVRFVPSKTGIEVATLTDGIKAKWADAQTPMNNGTRLVTGNTKFLLREGITQIEFDNLAKVTIESPAEFEIVTGDQVKLNYGRLYATVPQSAIGFAVQTPSARIIDLGTEFGIDASISGDTCLHVMKGKTTLIAGEKSSKVSMEVTAGIAKKVLCFTQTVSDIKFREDVFVRNINSNTNMLWRGQKEVNLADIVGGGNGFWTGKTDVGIDPMSGKFSKESSGTRNSPNDYHPVPGNPYIDGVFVPNGRTPQIISSQGHLFRQCPVTSGLCSERIIGSPVRSLDTRIEQNKEVSDSLAHSLLVHANMGITFDLESIRQFLPDARIIRFQSKFGIRKWATHPSASNADFWVLVDGNLRYEKKQVKIDELNSIDIELSEDDRFLTLVETDGGDPEGRILDGTVLSPSDSDWGVFADPVLVLK
jgi:hypothetical protein